MNISGSKALTETPLVYYRALSSYPGIIDGIDFFGQAPLAEECIGELLKNQAFEATAEPSSSLISPIRRLYFEARNHERKTGIPIVGIGYPLLSFFHQRQLIVAPLLIWPVQLDAHVKSTSQWHLRYSPSHQIKINPYLLNYWQTYFGWNYKQITAEFKTYPALLQKTINGLLDKIAAEMLKNDDKAGDIHLHPPFSLNPLPSLSVFESSEKKISVIWSAVLGGFHPIYQHLPVNISLLKPAGLEWPDRPFGLGVLEPDQASAVDLIQQQRSSIITGPPEQLMPLFPFLLSNFLSNGRTSLVVASQQQQLKELFDQLAGHELDSYAFLFRNAHADWLLIKKLVNQKASKQDRSPFDFRRFETLQSNLNKLQQHLEHLYSTARESVFQEMNFRETVGYFLHHQKRQGRELLNSQLEAENFSFSMAEYEDILKALEKSHPLYQKINTLNHPLETLHPSILSFLEEQEALDSLEQKIERAIAQLTDLQHRYIAVLNRYADQLESYYHSVHKEQAQLLEQLETKLSNYEKKYGVDFQLTSLASLRLIGRFSGKYRTILQAKEEVIDLYQRLIAYYRKHAYFSFEFNSPNERRNLSRWTPDLEAFKAALDAWRRQLPEQIKRELLRLSPGNTQKAIDMDDDIGQLESSLDEALEQLNRSELFREQFKNVMLTSQKQQQFLETVMDKIEQTQVFLRDFYAYFRWKKCWMSLSPESQSVVRALTKVKPGDWPTAFKSWFLHHRLKGVDHDRLPGPAMDLEAFARQLTNLQEQLPAQIHALWSTRMEKARKDWKAADRNSYQQFFSRSSIDENNQFHIIDVIRRHLQVITQHLPLFLASPQAAMQLGRDEDFKFDYVILLDGPLQGLQQAQSAFQLGKKIIVMGQEHQKVLCPYQQPLWDYLGELPKYELPADDRSSNSPIRPEIIQAEGWYNEQEEVNEAEARQTLKLLNAIERTPQRTYPCVQVVCMTSAQRDCIYGYLLDIKQRNLAGKEKIQQLERNGLKVYSIDELPFPSADILIINNTFGPINREGEVSEKTERWKRPKFMGQLKALFSHPYKKIFVLNSIPDSTLAELRRDEHFYARFLDHSTPFTSTDLQKMEKDASLAKEVSDKLYFVKEVAGLLKPLLASHRLEFSEEPTPSSKIIVINPIGAPEQKAGILPDGFFGNTPSSHFLWEKLQKERYKDQNITIIPTWSVNWWRDHRREAQKLIDAILGVFDN